MRKCTAWGPLSFRSFYVSLLQHTWFILQSLATSCLIYLIWIRCVEAGKHLRPAE